MKYTRYNLKPKRKNNNFLLYLSVTLILALVLGTVINKAFRNSKALWFGKESEVSSSSEMEKNKGAEENVQEPFQKPDAADKNDGQGQSEAVVGGTKELYVLQCGVFKVEGNADEMMKRLPATCIPFTVKDGEVSKVMAGIYNKEDADREVSELKEKGIETSRVIVSMKINDLSSVQMAEGIDGILQVVEKLKDGTVKSVKSGDLKAWSSSLDKLDKKSSDYENASCIKECIASLPEEVDKSGGKKLLSDVYNVIIKYKK